MDWLIDQYISGLKEKANGRGWVSPGDVPEHLIKLAGEILTHCTLRLTERRGLTLAVADSVVELPVILRNCSKNLPLRCEDLDAIQRAVRSMGVMVYAQTGRHMVEDSRYTELVLALYRPVELATVEQLREQLKDPNYRPK